jgi:hypothetical protein
VSYLDVQDQIVARVKEVPYIDVYEDEMSDEAFAAILADSNQIKPFVTISFGGLLDPRRRINGIVGAKTHSQDTTLVIRCVASTSRTSRQVQQLVFDKLIGFVPTNCGEIQTALFGGTGQVSSLGNPTRFASVQAYRFLVNSDYTV